MTDLEYKELLKLAVENLKEKTIKEIENVVTHIFDLAFDFGMDYGVIKMP